MLPECSRYRVRSCPPFGRAFLHQEYNPIWFNEQRNGTDWFAAFGDYRFEFKGLGSRVSGNGSTGCQKDRLLWVPCISGAVLNRDQQENHTF